jgi:hypothetical protein
MFEIELDIFSGRPNPRWTLDAVRAREDDCVVAVEDQGLKRTVSSGATGLLAEQRLGIGKADRKRGGRTIVTISRA